MNYVKSVEGVDKIRLLTIEGRGDIFGVDNSHNINYVMCIVETFWRFVLVFTQYNAAMHESSQTPPMCLHFYTTLQSSQ